MENTKKSALALLPLGLFLGLFLGSGLYYNFIGAPMAFYKVPAPIAALAGIILAFIIGKDKFEDKIDTFIKGVGNENIITMCLIFLLSGSFTQVARVIGSVESTVNFGLSIIPPALLLPGIFIIAAFISTAMGTSMGTIAAVAPIAVGLSEQAGLPMAVAMAGVIGGAMFGDNLSMISDTTIAATKTQGCEMKDKFIMNFKIALPAALITIVLMMFYGFSGVTPDGIQYSIIKVLPYFTVLALALMGINVFIVLIVGILFTGAIGLAEGVFNMTTYSQAIYAGFTGMQSIFILSLFIGGLAAMITKDGGINWILNLINRRIKGIKGAELGIGALVSIADLCTANNTVAIVITGPMAKKVAEENGVDPRRSASILDIFSCVFQGIIPYGAQLLLAGSIAGLSPLQMMPYLYYPYLLAVMVLLAIQFRFPKVKEKVPVLNNKDTLAKA
jgi:Na+/H+ antiporter NhaC